VRHRRGARATGTTGTTTGTARATTRRAAPRRPAPVRAVAAAVALLATVAGLAGCQNGGNDTEPPNVVDTARLAVVRTDPLLGAARNVTAATTDTGSSNTAYLRAQLVLERTIPQATPGTPPTDAQNLAAARALTAAARAGGWRITSVVCSDATPKRYTVQAFRRMPPPETGGGPFTVGLRIENQRVTAIVPYHLDAADPFPAPRESVPAAASCIETPGALPNAGRAVVVGRTGPTIA
jgi:hypothetical protein